MNNDRSSRVYCHAISKMKSKQPVNNKTQTNIEEEPDFSSVQIVLEEKNRVIDKLKKQLHNQRIQLEFYIKKEMNSPLMVEFAKTCLPELSEENMTVALAMNKFYRELGQKSRVMNLYDKVCNIAGKTNCIIQTQEVILNEIISSLRQHMNPSDIKKFLGNFDINTNYIEVFNSLLETTLDLKNSMNSFRVCCDKLVTAEEKRNEIVEQVYSLPQEERTICNYLVNIQMEKCELECVVKELSKQRKKLEPIVDEIDIIENNLRLLHDNFDNALDDESVITQINTPSDKNLPDYCVTKMLEKVYSQAMSLLAVSRDQRDKYNKEIEQLKEENKKLREIIRHVNGKHLGGKGTAADFTDVEKLHNVIKKTITESRRSEKVKNDELRQKIQECEELKKKLSQVCFEKAKLERFLQEDSSEINEFFWELRGKRFPYKCQENSQK